MLKLTSILKKAKFGNVVLPIIAVMMATTMIWAAAVSNGNETSNEVIAQAASESSTQATTDNTTTSAPAPAAVNSDNAASDVSSESTCSSDVQAPVSSAANTPSVTKAAAVTTGAPSNCTAATANKNACPSFAKNAAGCLSCPSCGCPQSICEGGNCNTANCKTAACTLCDKTSNSIAGKCPFQFNLPAALAAATNGGSTCPKVTSNCPSTAAPAATTPAPAVTKPVTAAPKPVTTAAPAATAPAKPVTTAPAQSGNLAQYAQDVFNIVNQERANAGLNPLAYDTQIEQAANLRAQEIVQSFSHTRPNGTSCFTVFKEMGISYTMVAENIAYGQRTPAEVMNGWMNSEGHRKNILTPELTNIGVGVYQSGNTIYWVQLFKRG